MSLNNNNETEKLTEFSVVLPNECCNDSLEGTTFVPPEITGNPYQPSKMVEELPTTLKEKKTGFLCACQNYLGIFFTLGSGFIFTCAGIIVKYMKDYHPISLAVFRFQGVLLPALALALYSHYVKRDQVFSTIWPLTDKEKLKRFIFTGVRGVLGGSALILLFYSIKSLSLADALVISSCRPVFVTFMAHVFLGEPCGIFPVFAATLTILGVGVIARPPILTGAEAVDTETMVSSSI